MRDRASIPPEKRPKFIISIYLIYVKNGKVLLTRRFNTGYCDGKYSLPAGHLDEHETLTEAISREVKEEIGLSTKPKDFKVVHIMHRKESDERLDVFFTAKNIKGESINKEPHLCDDVKWFSLNKLPENIIPYIKEAIANSLKGKIYSEIGWR